MEENNLLFYRLRSVRSRKRIIKKDIEKQIRKKYKRSKELISMRRDIPLIPLDKPYQKGFVRCFAVREDVGRSKDRIFFEGILKKINTYMYSENRRFLKKKRKFGRKKYIEREQKLDRIFPWEWNSPKTGLTSREKQYFLKRENYNSVKKKTTVYYEFIEPWRFCLKVKPYMITHYKPIDAELEREYHALDSYLKQHSVQGIICKKILGKSDKWFYKKKTNLIESKKYFHYKTSAREIAEHLEDFDVRKF